MAVVREGGLREGERGLIEGKGSQGAGRMVSGHAQFVWPTRGLARSIPGLVFDA